MEQPKIHIDEIRDELLEFLETVKDWSPTATPDERTAIFMVLLQEMPGALGWDMVKENYKTKAAKAGS
jgi:hypothetical protein